MIVKPPQELQKIIGYQFIDISLLKQALTHRSAAGNNNERLEFLGDSVVGVIIAHELYTRMQDAAEGDLSRFRSSLVKREGLAARARDIDLGNFLLLGGGELKSGGFRRDSTLADAFEAVIGAVYLDGGFEKCRDVVLALFKQVIDDLLDEGLQKDPKTTLQEYLQANQFSLPEYELLEVSGKEHEQIFKVACSCAATDIATEGEAGSRRAAEKLAAKNMLKLLLNNNSEKDATSGKDTTSGKDNG